MNTIAYSMYMYNYIYIYIYYILYIYIHAYTYMCMIFLYFDVGKFIDQKLQRSGARLLVPPT